MGGKKKRGDEESNGNDGGKANVHFPYNMDRSMDK